jgi:phosphoglycolate phosphatase-like HAD superfamily hydrolase
MHTTHKWAHSFDLWGVLVKKAPAGKEVLRMYKEIAPHDPATLEQNVRNYQGVLDGAQWAVGPLKRQYVQAVEDSVWPAVADGRAAIDASRVLYEDAVDAMAALQGRNEGVCVFTTAKSDWIVTALQRKNPQLAQRLLGVFDGDKSEATSFQGLAQKLDGYRLGMHVEDEVGPLNCARESGMYHGPLLYVARRPDARSYDGIVTVPNLEGIARIGGYR